MGHCTACCVATTKKDDRSNAGPAPIKLDGGVTHKTKTTRERAHMKTLEEFKKAQAEEMGLVDPIAPKTLENKLEAVTPLGEQAAPEEVPNVEQPNAFAVPEPDLGARGSIDKSYSSWGKTESIMHTEPQQPVDSDDDVPLYDAWPTYPSDEEDGCHDERGHHH